MFRASVSCESVLCSAFVTGYIGLALFVTGYIGLALFVTRYIGLALFVPLFSDIKFKFNP